MYMLFSKKRIIGNVNFTVLNRKKGSSLSNTVFLSFYLNKLVLNWHILGHYLTVVLTAVVLTATPSCPVIKLSNGSRGCHHQEVSLIRQNGMR